MLAVSVFLRQCERERAMCVIMCICLRHTRHINNKQSMKIETFVRVGNKIGWEIRRRYWEPSKLYLALISHLPTSSVLEKKVLRFVWIFLHSHPLMRVLSYSQPSHFSSALQMVRFHVTQKCLQLQRSVSSRGKKEETTQNISISCCHCALFSHAARLAHCRCQSVVLPVCHSVLMIQVLFISVLVFVYKQNPS